MKKNKFTTVFANDILPEAQTGWTRYMSKYRQNTENFHLASIVDLVKQAKEGSFSFLFYFGVLSPSLASVIYWTTT